MGKTATAAADRLEDYWRQVGGHCYRNVVVSGTVKDWPPETPNHAVDAVIVHGFPNPRIADWVGHEQAFADDVASRAITILSPRGYADRTAFGMLLAGRELFSRSYPEHGTIRLVALSDNREANMDWVYVRHGIEIVWPTETE